MIYFNCDYNEGAHPSILEKLLQTNLEQTPGYGEDNYCAQAAKEIKALCGCPEADVHFTVGGTQTNLIVIDAALRSYQGALCADTGHINVHETGAVEATGHKVLALPHTEGKITAAQVQEAMEAHLSDPASEHTVQPRLVYISSPTEFGTLYSCAELEALSGICRRYGLYLFLDGARLGYGLAAAENTVTLEHLAKYCDAFYIGGTKCGALFGEAIVLTHPDLKRDFRLFCGFLPESSRRRTRTDSDLYLLGYTGRGCESSDSGNSGTLIRERLHGSVKGGSISD